MGPLAAVDDRAHDHDLLPFAEGHDGVGHLLDGLLADGLAAVRAESVADAGIEQAQVVVDFRNRPDRRPGDCGWSSSGRWKWPATGLRYSRRRACPSGPKNLAGIGRQGFDVAPLASA